MSESAHGAAGLGDTVWGIATAAGGARAAIRISGPDAFQAAARALEIPSGLPHERAAASRSGRLFGQSFECLVLTMPGPRSFTGEDVVELHLPGSELLAQRVGERSGARPARPGEFTRRAYENGRLDLASAEAVMDLVHASSVDQRRSALHVLRGGLREAVDDVLGQLLDVVSVLESGLDFTAGETGEVAVDDWLPALERAARSVAALENSIPAARSGGGELLLLGAANAGKSSLCNALAGAERSLVSDVRGTTRDVLRVEVGSGCVLLDAPGDLREGAEDDVRALELRDALAARAGGVLAVIDPAGDGGAMPVAAASAFPPVVAVVQTRADRCPEPPEPIGMPADVPRFVVSCVSGEGIDGLRDWLRQRPDRAGASAGRVATHVREAAAAIRAAATMSEPLPELVAFELQEAMRHLELVAGRATPDDVLDRIFGEFCLGK